MWMFRILKVFIRAALLPKVHQCCSSFIFTHISGKKINASYLITNIPIILMFHNCPCRLGRRASGHTDCLLLYIINGKYWSKTEPAVMRKLLYLGTNMATMIFAYWVMGWLRCENRAAPVNISVQTTPNGSRSYFANTTVLKLLFALFHTSPAPRGHDCVCTLMIVFYFIFLDTFRGQRNGWPLLLFSQS